MQHTYVLSMIPSQELIEQEQQAAVDYKDRIKHLNSFNTAEDFWACYQFLK